MVFFSSPLVIVLWVMVGLSALFPLIRSLRKAREYNDSEQR
jgi:hypothetical protein